MEHPRPDAPRGDAEEELRPEDEEDAAVLRERSEGAHAEQVTDDANLREDPTPPGQ